MREPKRLPREEAFAVEHGCWSLVLRRPAPTAKPRPALFLDRDGVVVEDRDDYLRRVEDVVMIDGAAAVIRRANDLGVPVIIVTNQGGLGLGLYDWQAFAEVQETILSRLADDGARVDAVLACPYHPEAAAPYRHPDHPARKPNAGMLRHAADLLPLDIEGSWIVGDRATDLEAGRKAGLAGGVHVLTGYGQAHRAAALALGGSRFQAISAASIAEAGDLIPLLQPERLRR